MSRSVTIKRVLCCLLAAALLGLGMGIPAVRVSAGPLSASQEQDKQAAKDKVDALQQQLDAEKKKLNATKKKGQNAAAAKQSYQAQSGLVTQQIQTLTVSLDSTNAAIAEKENEIAQKQADIDARWDSFKEQMVAMQMMHDAGTVAMLANVHSLYELLTFSDALQQISQRQTDVLEDMKQRRDELKAAQEELQGQKAELESQKQQLDAKRQELAASIQMADQTITAAQAEAQAQQVQVDATSEALRAAQAEFNQYISSLPDSGAPFVGETFVWPTVSGRITQYYGNNGHGGMDIGAVRPGVAGDPIYAAASGVVQKAEYHQHTYSYGNYVVLDHGGGIKTLYAHMTSYIVSPGQYVNQGQVIGYMGNTGYSFGAHLHFEVRVHGGRVNPMNYYQKA